MNSYQFLIFSSSFSSEVSDLKNGLTDLAPSIRAYLSRSYIKDIDDKFLQKHSIVLSLVFFTKLVLNLVSWNPGKKNMVKQMFIYFVFLCTVSQYSSK